MEKKSGILSRETKTTAIEKKKTRQQLGCLPGEREATGAFMRDLITCSRRKILESDLTLRDPWSDHGWKGLKPRLGVEIKCRKIFGHQIDRFHADLTEVFAIDIYKCSNTLIRSSICTGTYAVTGQPTESNFPETDPCV